MGSSNGAEARTEIGLRDTNNFNFIKRVKRKGFRIRKQSFRRIRHEKKGRNRRKENWVGFWNFWTER